MCGKVIIIIFFFFFVNDVFSKTADLMQSPKFDGTPRKIIYKCCIQSSNCNFKIKF